MILTPRNAAGQSESEPPPMPPRGYMPPPPGVAPVGPGTPEDRPPMLDPHEKMRVRTAAFRAKQVYPGAVGDLIAKELLDWEGFGFRFGTSGGMIRRLVDEVMRPQAE